MIVKYRKTLAFVFVICAMVCGLAAGTLIGGKYFVPAGSGLAGPFMALGYGIVGAVLALGGAIGTLMLARGRAFAAIALPTIVAGVVLALLIGFRFFQASEEQDRFLADQRASLPFFDMRLVYRDETLSTPFSIFDYDGSEHRFTVTSLDQSVCSGKLSPTSEEKLTLLVVLRHVEGLLTSDDDPCGDSPGPPAVELSFHIEEHMPPDTRGDLLLSRACISRHSELLDVISSVVKVYEDLTPLCE